MKTSQVKNKLELKKVSVLELSKAELLEINGGTGVLWTIISEPRGKVHHH